MAWDFVVNASALGDRFGVVFALLPICFRLTTDGFSWFWVERGEIEFFVCFWAFRRG